jgi:guanylate kinase
MSVVFIISAPSGSGKSTLVNRLMQEVPNLCFSISYTTRAPRGHEIPGISYHFTTREDFEERLAKHEFLEHADVFGNYYGTHRSELAHAQGRGKDLVLDIDVQGAAQLRKSIPDAVTIFVLAPSREELEKRLRSRGEDSDEVIERRLADAAREIRNYYLYDYVLINEDIDESARTLASIVRAERVRRTRIEDKLRPILRSFEDAEKIEVNDV